MFNDNDDNIDDDSNNDIDEVDVKIVHWCHFIKIRKYIINTNLK